MAVDKYWDMYNRGTSAEMDSTLQALADEKFQFIGDPGQYYEGDASQTQGANPLLLQLLGAYQSGGLPGVGLEAITSGAGAHENIDSLINENSLMEFLSKLLMGGGSGATSKLIK